MRKLFLTLLCLAALCSGARATDAGPGFDAFFRDTTLRVDCILAGDSRGAAIFLDRLMSFEGWAGRRHSLGTTPLRGNGRVELLDPLSGACLYAQSFSTLFQEWQATEEATRTRKSFESVFLLPMPKAEVLLRISLLDLRGNPSATYEQTVNPDDILISQVQTPLPEHKYLLHNGEPQDCIDVAIVAEGYTAEEKDMFYSHAARAALAILSHEPFSKYTDRFNFVAVALESQDSGVSVPYEGVWKNTALQSSFSTFYIDRYLTTLKVKNIADKLGSLPYEHIIILANTETYGGGGIYNFYTLTTARHPMFDPVVVHEFGHSFGGLADEYYYDDMYSPYYFPDSEPWEQNITTIADFDSKWNDMLPEGYPAVGVFSLTVDAAGETAADTAPYTFPSRPVEDGRLWEEIAGGKSAAEFIGVYEGAGYVSKGVYRSFPDCRMKTNTAPAFCPVCQRALERLILFYTE